MMCMDTPHLSAEQHELTALAQLQNVEDSWVCVSPRRCMEGFALENEFLMGAAGASRETRALFSF